MLIHWLFVGPNYDFLANTFSQAIGTYAYLKVPVPINRHLCLLIGTGVY